MSIWSEHYTEVIKVHRCQGTNAYGDIEFSPPLDMDGENFVCQIDYTRKEVLNKDGEKVISEAAALSDTPLPPLSIVYADGQRFEVKSCQPIKDIFGTLDHYEITL
jgi:hypothetical protein